MFSAAGKSAVTSGYNINNSLRFRNSAGGLLNRTPSVTGNNQRFTWSGWVKRGTIGAEAKLFGASTSTSNVWYLMFGDNVVDALTFGYFTGSHPVRLTTTQLFRDPSAWYHIIVSVDTTQATSSNRVLIYVNGTQVTSFETATYPTLNQTTLFNTSGTPNYLGMTTTGTGGSFDGYMAEVNFIDGQALTPSSFGETNTTTGVWQPKAYTGTYGTNGFYQKYSNIALTSGSNTGLGQDFSGNGNFWNTNNISVTAGTTYDAMIDSPTNTSATVANYCVLNPLDRNSGMSPINGNLDATASTAAWKSIKSTMFFASGKWYWEAIPTVLGNEEYSIFGLAVQSESNDNYVGASNSANVASIQFNAGGISVATLYGSGKYTTSISSVDLSVNQVLMFAYDADAGKLWIGKDGTWFNSGVPASGTGACFTSLPNLMTPTFSVYSSTNTISLNFGQRTFAYTPPTGFNRLNTFNLPTSTIVKGNSYMDATLYTGTGASLSVTNAAGFRPDFVWMKSRSAATDHGLYDSVRGTTNDLVSNSTAAATTQAQGLTAFNSNGFTVGTLAKLNTNTATYVGWQWRAGEGTSSSNTNGTIPSTVSVNATAGFSIVTYTGTGANGTVGHGLGVAPKMIIVKSRSISPTNWVTYHTSLGNTTMLMLNDTAAAAVASANYWNNTSPTSSVFTIGIGGSVNPNGGTMVAYCWAEIAGFSAFGSYTGNGSTDGPFVYTGFRPKFVLIKVTSVANDWGIYDSSRNPSNLAGLVLRPNTSGAEVSASNIDFLSNGFKLRNNAATTEYNGNGSTYIYAAFAENPFKNALAR